MFACLRPVYSGCLGGINTNHPAVKLVQVTQREHFLCFLWEHTVGAAAISGASYVIICQVSHWYQVFRIGIWREKVRLVHPSSLLSSWCHNVCSWFTSNFGLIVTYLPFYRKTYVCHFCCFCVTWSKAAPANFQYIITAHSPDSLYQLKAPMLLTV